MTTTDTPNDADDALTARQTRREPLLVLLSRMQRGVLRDAERPLLRAAVETELADGDEAHAEAAATREGIGKLRDQHEAHRTAVSEALGLGTSAPWDAIEERAVAVKDAAYERAELLESARDALSTAGQNGPHADDWPAIAPGIEALAAERDVAVEGERRAMQQRKEMAEERYAWQERGDRAEKRADLADRVKRTAAKDAADALARAEKAEVEAKTLRVAQPANGRLYDCAVALKQRAEKAEERARKAERAADLLAGSHRRAEQAEAAITRVRAVAGWDLNGWSDLSPEKVLAALDGTGAAEPEHTGEAHETRRQQVAAALGLVPGAGWDAILDCAGKTREAAKERAAALQDARDVLARAGYPTDSNGWLVLAPTIRKVTDEVKLLRGTSEVDRREASNRRTALAATLQRGPGADWHAVHAAAAEFVRRTDEAEATVSRVREQVAEWRNWEGTEHARRDILRALGDTPEPQPQDPATSRTAPGESQ